LAAVGSFFVIDPLPKLPVVSSCSEENYPHSNSQIWWCSTRTTERGKKWTYTRKHLYSIPWGW